MGFELKDGWVVVERLDPGISSGGYFSEQYLVRRPDGTEAFLKALDFSPAAGAPDLAGALQELTEAFVFERDLVMHCADGHLSRVITALDHGEIDVPGYGLLSRVPYIVFEKAEHDARVHLSELDELDIAWRLRSMHHVATGLMQLHDRGIAHQDLKPSNVLVFIDSTSKVGDLGRASREGISAPHDGLLIPGKHTYAPPELLYGYGDPDVRARRRASDMYQLGGLLYFFFTGSGLTPGLAGAIDSSHVWTAWGGPYEDVLPYVRDGFERILEEFASRVPPDLREELTALLQYLSDPDPRLRGHPASRRVAHGNPYSFERFVSRFNALATAAEISLRATLS